MVLTGLEVFSVACNAMAAIDFSLKTIRLCRAVYDGKDVEADVKESAASMMEVSARIDAHCQSSTSANLDERNLLSIAAKCQEASRNVENVINSINKGRNKGKVLSAVRIGVKTLWSKKELDNLEKTLDKYKSAMETHLLFRVWYVASFSRPTSSETVQS